MVPRGDPPRPIPKPPRRPQPGEVVILDPSERWRHELLVAVAGNPALVAGTLETLRRSYRVEETPSGVVARDIAKLVGPIADAIFERAQAGREERRIALEEGLADGGPS